MDTTDPDGPADTRLMGIVHEALRRDLRRTRTVLTAIPPPVDDRRRAIARHLAWMMHFLHAHHRTEDEGLYPMVRERDHAAATLLDQMNADHEVIAPGIERVEAAAADYRRGDTDGQRERLLAALDDLEERLLPHLRREEDEMMPVVSSTITERELRQWDEEQNIKPKSLAQLGREGHWILDGLGPDDRKVVLHLVPPVPRFLLLHGFAGAYRRHLAACWGEPPGARRRVHKRGRTEVVVDAQPDAVWNVVRDVTRVGEWSHECVGAGWLGGATAAVAGARFRGRNRNGIFRWGRVCEVTEAMPGELAWRTVPTLLYPDSTEWRIRLDDADGRTRIEQTFDVVKVPKLLDVVYGTMIPAHRDRTRALTDDLRRLGDLAARTSARAPDRTVP
jgi:hemerythrin-like domain-containing protein